jgi:hypothetical protein
MLGGIERGICGLDQVTRLLLVVWLGTSHPTLTVTV